MTMTSDERREVAARLRTLADGERPMAECSVDALYTALGLPCSGTGIECAVVGYLADLIDPTCHVVSTILYDWSDGPEYCHELSCGHTCDTSWPEPPNFCTECGARVVEKEEDDGV